MCNLIDDIAPDFVLALGQAEGRRELTPERVAINIDDARRLVVRGFFNEIVGQIKNEEIEDRLMAHIDGELAKVGK